MSSFLVRSATGGVVSVLNTSDEAARNISPSLTTRPSHLHEGPFLVRSASGRIVSVLNPSDEPSRYTSASPAPDTFHEYGRPCQAPPVTTRKMHPCSYTQCNQSFTTFGHLNRHRKIHTGDKEHICPWKECYKRCGRLDNLVQHFRVHLPRQALSNAEVRIAIVRVRSEAEATAKRNEINIPTSDMDTISEVDSAETLIAALSMSSPPPLGSLSE